MSTALDSQIGFKKETTFKTPATPDTFVEFTEEDFAWSPTFSQGTGQRYGRRVDASDRRVLVKEEAGGSFTQELITKGLGKLFEAALGTGVSTVVSGAAYQQLFTPAVDDFLPSYTIQKGIPMLGGASQPQTFAGCVCSGFELTASNAGIPTIKWNWLGAGVDTSTALAVASYLASTQLLSFVHGSIRVGGVVTPPTTTALAVGGTVAANIRDASFVYENGLDENGWFLNGSSKRGRKPALGLRKGTGTLTAEYDSNVLRDAYLAQTDLSLVLQFKHSTAIAGANYPTIEITIPNIRLEGELPKAAGGDVVTQSVGFTMLDGRAAAHPIYVAVVTAETAI
jgi:hypothetical protein